jgi:molybdopterin molybdotransferase
MSNPMPTRNAEHAARALGVEEARQRILAEVKPVQDRERVALRSALGRVLAEDIRSPIDVPGHTNSGVDGYAFAARDLPVSGDRDYRVLGTAWAGRPFTGRVDAGGCVRIMTGAPLPPGTDTVVMQEQAHVAGDRVRINVGHEAGQNVRAAGEDLARGETALAAGKRLTPADLGLLASAGLAEVGVYRPVRVAFFSTGDELRSVGEPLGPGEIHDSNRYTLYGMLARVGAEILDLGVVRDRREAVRDAFIQASATADAIITTGGVSVGDADYVKETLAALGGVSFWQIAMKPGRPLAFGHLGPAAFFGLPGNPVAVMVTFHQLVQPALQCMMGEADVGAPATFPVRSASRFRKRPGRTEYQRAVLARDATGALVVHSAGQQGSGILRSMSLANCYVILPEAAGDIEPGSFVEVQPFAGLA